MDDAAAISGYAAFSEGTSYRNNDYVYFRNKLSADIDIVKEVLKVQADYSYNYTTRKRIDVQNPVKYSKKPGVYLLESESAGASLSQVDYETALPGGQRLPDLYAPNSAPTTI